MPGDWWPAPARQYGAGLLADNGSGLDRLAAAGWTDAWQAPRLILGRMPDWNPSAIWGQFDHAIGWSRPPPER